MSGNNENGDDYFEDENLAFLPADHPLLARIQGALKKTLEEEHERVNLQLLEKENRLKKLEREKEDIGVQLYGVQQNLAELQLTFEQTHENYNVIQKLRIEAEQQLAILSQDFNNKKVQVDELEKKCNRAADELSKLNRTLKQIDEYNNQMKNEILIEKRTTYRAEENIAALEKDKKKQDFLIDSMNEEIKRLKEQKVIIEAQLISQKEETKNAQQILKEAYIEMENIIASKKNLLERWQKCLLEMQRRDKALQVIKDAFTAQNEMNIQIGTELTGVNNEIRKEAGISENLTANNNKLEMVKDFLDKDKAKLEHQRDKLEAQISILTQSLGQTEEEIKKIEIDNKGLEDQMSLIETNIMRMHTETKKIYEEIINKINDHKTIEKTAANLLKQTHLINGEIEELEVDIEGIENEIARVNIDKLNTNSQIELLNKKKREVSKERKEKEKIVTKYEQEIRQGHDINEKKQKDVGQLNKLHDKLKNNATEATRGSKEAEKNNIVKEIKKINEECESMHRDWIKKQTKIVNFQAELNEKQADLSQMKTREVILEQKKMRLNSIYSSHEKEIRLIKNSLKNLQTEMNRLNDGLSKNQNMETKLKNENFNIESEFIEKLKELEKESVRLEVDVDRLKEEKAELLSSILEAERQILLWERKIQLEKEMQEALDPNIGQSEIQLLKKEIHRMELRLEELRKKQEQMIKDMERAVFKRETIQLKYVKNEDDENKSKAKGTESKTQIAKHIETLKSTLQQTTKNSKQLENQVKQLQEELESINQQIEDLNERLTENEGELGARAQALIQKKMEKLRNIFEISKLQIQSKIYENIATNKMKLDYPEDILRRKYDEQRSINRNIQNVLKTIFNDHSQFSAVISPLIDI